MRSIKTPMKAERLTTLRILYDYKTGVFRMEALKQWEPDLDFSKYNKEFYVESILTDDVKYYNTKEVEALFEKYNLADYLEDIKNLLIEGRHFGIEAYYHEGYDILYMSNQHSRKLGINNKWHATLAGGIRRHDKNEEEIDVIIDGLNLGRGMSFKNVAGRINMGGCKQTVTMDPIDLNNLQHVGFLGFCIDSCRTMTGPDMNFPTELADAENEHFSMQYTNGPKYSVLGETGVPTAYGVYKTLKQAVNYKEGTESLAGKTATVVGLGAVGWYMAEYLLEEVDKLYIADLNPARAEQFKSEHEGNIACIPLEGAYYNECDILSPCAIGGVFSDETIPKLNCKYIWGSSNNGLKASGAEEEIRLAELLKARDIVYQVEWWHNTAGVICGFQEYIYGKSATQEKLYETIDSTMPKSTYMNLKQADELGITPTENAYRLADEIIYGDKTLEDINW
ncbi:MAG: Glu/Leu/Phe/Val dehydrogenase family protein [Mogibacterium sp.]|nr:Glu/Leu/Phe/Val dehydrogenase family protein [Mogibacterium sp.]